MLHVQSEGIFSLKLFPKCNNLVILQFWNFVTVFCESVLAYLSFYQKYHSNSELNNQTQSLSMAGGGTENVKSFTIPLPGEKYLTMTLNLGISTDFIRFAAQHCQEIRRQGFKKSWFPRMLLMGGGLEIAYSWWIVKTFIFGGFLCSSLNIWLNRVGWWSFFF